MKLMHNITISVFSREDENQEMIMNGLQFLVPLDFEKEELSLLTDRAEAYDNSYIFIYSLKIHKERHCKKIIKNLFMLLSHQQKKSLDKHKYERLDEEAIFYIRFDKAELMNSRLLIVDHGECYHLKIKLAAYPKNRDEGKKILDQVLTKFLH